MVEFILHTIGFGLLFGGRFNSIASYIFLAVNIAMLIAFLNDRPLRSTIFGMKQLASVALLILRLDTGKEKMRTPEAYNAQQRRPSVDLQNIPTGNKIRRGSHS